MHCSISYVGNLRRKRDVQREIVLMACDGGLYEVGNPLVKRYGTNIGHRRAEACHLLFAMTPLQSDDQRLFVREILVQRPNAHPGQLRYAIGSQARISFMHQNVSSSLEHRFDSSNRPGLKRLFPWLRYRHGSVGDYASSKYEALLILFWLHYGVQLS